jgi:hypothetical protein
VNVADWIQLGILAVTGFAVALSIRSVRDELWLQTFSDYTRRYLDILDSLPEEARVPEGSVDPEALLPDERRRLLISLRRYFNLCSQEFYLRNRKRIDTETWRIWESGIRATMRLPTFRTGWGILGKEYAYFVGFHSFMEDVLRGAESEPSLPIVPAG